MLRKEQTPAGHASLASTTAAPHSAWTPQETSLPLLRAIAASVAFAILRSYSGSLKSQYEGLPLGSCQKPTAELRKRDALKILDGFAVGHASLMPVRIWGLRRWRRRA